VPLAWADHLSVANSQPFCFHPALSVAAGNNKEGNDS
jgi:hypothetical protein